ncbi:glycosyltransferase [Yonghaparkia sp. Root332]|uniref:glycosyltransferase n=1 Tax=Yonghaparkia sp. Root332 TaxID=1736516 RepID=UPI0006F71DDE|nr:glycosyltransferase [Yonghaparkia sp. Root332]KQV25483.1 hypothetical protein ASC54_00270 [Yonghaparkia sp. Root332]
MRIALATGLLPVPPTYFALQHGARLAGEHAVRMVALAADVRDPAVGVEVDAVVPSIGPWPARIAAALTTAPLSAAIQARRIAAFRPDVVHQHFATWSRGALDGAARASSPLVATLHGYDVFALERSGGSPLQRFHRRSAADAAARADRLLAVSEYLAARAVAAGFPADRLDVHYQGVDTDLFTPRPGSAERGAPRIVFIGALAERKGVDDLLAASIAIAPTAEHRLVVIGDGPLDATVRAAAAPHPHIDVLGSLPRDAVREQLRGARALVLPTRLHEGRREAAGLVLLEAQACGVPVIAYRSGGAPEMLEDGRTGIVVDEDDVRALAGAVSDIIGLTDRDWGEMSARARSFAVDRRSLTTSVARLAEIYRELSG